MSCNFASFQVSVQAIVPQAHERHHHPRQAAVERAGGERRHRQRLDMLVERLVVMLEPFVVGQVPRSCPVEDGADEAGPSEERPTRLVA